MVEFELLKYDDIVENSPLVFLLAGEKAPWEFAVIEHLKDGKSTYVRVANSAWPTNYWYFDGKSDWQRVLDLLSPFKPERVDSNFLGKFGFLVNGDTPMPAQSSFPGFGTELGVAVTEFQIIDILKRIADFAEAKNLGADTKLERLRRRIQSHKVRKFIRNSPDLILSISEWLASNGMGVSLVPQKGRIIWIPSQPEYLAAIDKLRDNLGEKN